MFMKLADMKDIATIIQSLVTAAALIMGGIWTYLLFVRKRQKYPRAKLEHRVAHWIVNKDTVLISIDIIVSNTSEVLLPLVSGTIDVHQVLPPDGKFLQLLAKAQPSTSHRVRSVNWPSLSPFPLDVDLKQRSVEIEPGESEQLHYTLLLSFEVQMIHVESYFNNVTKRRPLEWRLETFYDMRPDSSADDALLV